MNNKFTKSNWEPALWVRFTSPLAKVHISDNNKTYHLQFLKPKHNFHIYNNNLELRK